MHCKLGVGCLGGVTLWLSSRGQQGTQPPIPYGNLLVESNLQCWYCIWESNLTLIFGMSFRCEIKKFLKHVVVGMLHSGSHFNFHKG